MKRSLRPWKIVEALFGVGGLRHRHRDQAGDDELVVVEALHLLDPPAQGKPEDDDEEQGGDHRRERRLGPEAQHAVALAAGEPEKALPGFGWTCSLIANTVAVAPRPLRSRAGEEDGDPLPVSVSGCRASAATPAAPAGSTSTPNGLSDQRHRGPEVIVIHKHHLVDEFEDSLQRLRHRIRDRERSGDRPSPATETGRRAAKLCAMAGAPLAHTPTTLVSGRRDFSQRATPVISAPSPSWIDGGVDRILRGQLDADRPGALGNGGFQPVDHQVAALARRRHIRGRPYRGCWCTSTSAPSAPHAGDLPFRGVGPDEDLDRRTPVPGRVREPLPEVARGLTDPGEGGIELPCQAAKCRAP